MSEIGSSLNDGSESGTHKGLPTGGEIVLSPSYSSYDLDLFQRCGRLWDLQSRWKDPDDQGFSAPIAVGAGVSAGLSRARRGHTQKMIEEAIQDALAVKFIENPEWTLGGLYRIALKGVQAGLTANLGIKDIISADQKMYGRYRPDVVGRRENGELRVVDDKTKIQFDKRYLQETLDEYKRSNQLFGYAYEVGAYYGEPVTSVGINLIIIQPKAEALFYPFDIDQDELMQWAQSAQEDFQEMAHIDLGVRTARVRWTACRDYRYKKDCPMHKICHDLHGDESKAGTWYERRVSHRYNS